jgi:raffinose/stachyose/melibiose transport system permease protein
MTKMQKKNRIVAFLFLMPCILLTIIFIIFPILRTFSLSLTSWNGVGGAAKTFVGAKNYLSILSSTKFWNAMKNALYFMIGGFCILMPVSFLLALLVTSKMNFTGFFKTTYLLPVMLGTTAVALMWVFMLNAKFGLFAQMLTNMGLKDHVKDWLSIKNINTWIVVLVNEWMYTGYNMLIFAAGLVAIPEDIHDACKIDGCTGIKKLFLVTIPLCKNMFEVFSVICVTGCVKAFDIVWAMTKGGPMGSSATPAILLYTEGFQNKLMGRSSALGIILLLIGIGLTALMNGTLFKKEN